MINIQDCLSINCSIAKSPGIISHDKIQYCQKYAEEHDKCEHYCCHLCTNKDCYLLNKYNKGINEFKLFIFLAKYKNDKD